jgi:hypothetical protein
MRSTCQASFILLIVTVLGGCGPEGAAEESSGLKNGTVVQGLEGSPGLSVDIVATTSAQSSSVNVTGRIEHVITDKERTSFKLNDAQLKAAINAYFGRAPNDAYVRSPTPWGDLYTSYGWPQIKTVLLPKSAQILEITSEPVVVARNTFINNYNRETTFNTSITTSATNTSESNWSESNTIEVSQMIKYELGFLGTGGGGETTLSYSRGWGVGGSNSTSITVGSTSGAEVPVVPNWGVQSLISASRGTMKVRITYEAHLEGCTVVNYNPAHQGHHFWCLGIEGVMQAGGITNSIEFTETIEVGFFANDNIVVKPYIGPAWSHSGPVAGKPYCTLMNEPADPDSWGDNYLCSSVNPGFAWNSAGPIAGMRCTAIHEPVDPHTWNDNYLCVPESSPLNLSWSSAGPIPGLDCTQVNEPTDPHTWNDNYLCY